MHNCKINYIPITYSNSAQAACAVTLAPRWPRRLLIKAEAVSALVFPTSACRKRNCRFRLVTSMVSMSTTWMSSKEKCWGSMVERVQNSSHFRCLGFMFSFWVETWYKSVMKKKTYLKQWLVRSAKQPWNQTMLNLSEFRIPSHQHQWPESYSFLASSQWSQLLVRKHLHQRRDFFATARDRHGRASGYPIQTWSREVASSENLDCRFELYMASAVRKELLWSQSSEQGFLVFFLTRTKGL